MKLVENCTIIARAYLEKMWKSQVTKNTITPAVIMDHLHWNFMMHGMREIEFALFGTGECFFCIF